MSLLQFQASLAELIRLPEKNRGADLEVFLNRFQLTKAERERLEALAQDPKVKKYGNSMAGVRWETPELQLRLAPSLIPKNALEHLYRDIFEPKAVKVRFPQLTDTFLACMIEDLDARKVLKEAAPPSVFDLLKFERIQLSFYRGDIAVERELAPSQSVLRHSAYRILELTYDVPAYVLLMGEKGNEEALRKGPEPRKLTVLFIPDESEPGARYFEIDETVSQFLEALRNDPLAEVPLPSSYADLISLGLCKPLSLRRDR